MMGLSGGTKLEQTRRRLEAAEQRNPDAAPLIMQPLNYGMGPMT
jgi:hypothetical protein